MTRREDPDLHFEKNLWSAGMERLAGLDEAGRGAWAGPVAAAAVILPCLPELPCLLNGVRDSKQMRPTERTHWAEVIKDTALAWGIGAASSDEVDCLGILPATRLAMQRALEVLSTSPQYLLIDALRLPESELPQTAIIHGDAKSLSIAAASVLAKTTRDDEMRRMEMKFPGYGFARHKGYGTAAHREALLALGPCAIHRKSYAPIKRMLPPE